MLNFVRVKKAIAIFFLIAYLFSATELNQLLKLPFMVRHFIEHNEKDKGVGLLNFLCLHYHDHGMKNAKDENDMKLPFKSHENCVSSSLSVFIPAHFEGFVVKLIAISEKEQIPYSEDFISSAFLSSIWQPPKSC